MLKNIKNKLLITFSFTFFGFLFLSLNTFTHTAAATVVWDSDFNQFWSTPENWVGDTLPIAGDDLQLDSASNYYHFCDFGTTSFNSININYDVDIQCSDLYVDTAINVSTGNSIIESLIHLNGDLVINVADGATLEINNGIDLNGHNITFDSNNNGVIALNSSISGTGNILKTGMGPLNLNSSNSFTGSLTSDNGEINLNATGATGNISNSILIGDGVVLSTLINNADNGVTNGSNLEISSGAIWDLNSYDNTITTITGSGDVQLGATSTVTLTGGASYTTEIHFTGLGDVIKNSTGSIIFNPSSHSGTTGTFTVNNGIATINGTIGDTIYIANTGGRIRGSGIIDRLLGTGGTVSPGDALGGGFLTTNIVELLSNSIFNANIYGTTAGTNYGYMDTQGTFDISNATLNVNLGYTPTLGDSFKIIDTGIGSFGVFGEFNGLPNGSLFNVGGNFFQINYSSSDVTLTVVVAPNLSFSSFHANPTTSTPGTPVTIILVLTGNTGTPTGTVEFFANGVSIGTAVVDGSGTVTLTTSSLPLGTLDISAEYSGDSTYVGAVSGAGALSITVSTAQVLAPTGINLPSTLILFSLILSALGILSIKKYYEK